MPIIPPVPEFQPSREALSKWLGTRKQPQIFGRVTLPGLFQTYNYQKDASAFATVLILELLGLFALIVAWRRLDAVAIGVVVAFLIIDLFCAWRLHKNKHKFCLVENKKIMNDDDLKESAKLSASLSNENVIITICKIAIMAVAILKIYAFTVLSYRINGITFAVILVYAIVAMIHIYNTGYFFAEWNTRRRIKKDFKAFLSDPSSKGAGTSELEAKLNTVFIDNMILKEHHVNRHKLEKIEGETVRYQLMQFVTRQENRDQKAMVAEKGLEIQLQILREN
jgi:uncharacterized membrane protein YqjE